MRIRSSGTKRHGNPQSFRVFGFSPRILGALDARPSNKHTRRKTRMNVRLLWAAYALLVFHWHSARAQVNLANLWREAPTARVSPTLRGFVAAGPTQPASK
jgi:hypothetical protein